MIVHALVMDLATYASLSHQQPTSQEFIDLDLALEAALANLQPAIRNRRHASRAVLYPRSGVPSPHGPVVREADRKCHSVHAEGSRAIDKPLCAKRQQPVANHGSKMKVQASARSTRNRYSNRSPGCTARGPGYGTPVPRYAAALWNCTAAGSGRSHSRAREPASTSRCPVFRGFPRRSVNDRR